MPEGGKAAIVAILVSKNEIDSLIVPLLLYKPIERL